ncbi:ferritin-like domain-containing protein [Streptomyces violascens]|uniref:ferritin-like domain-containing protein n=1 Tax=Streptomyces violascens TaxID=67381 RepID=UPI0036C8428E
MSVFELPRLHFAGTATTKLPTGQRSGLVDLATQTALTDEGPFGTDRPSSEYHAFLQRRGPHFDASGRMSPEGCFSAAKGWNFDGNGHFWLDAAIVSVEIPGGGVDTADPVVGTSVDVWGHYNEYLRTTVNRARILDIDPASRWTTALMVGQFSFGRRDRSHDEGYLVTGRVRGLHPPRWVGFDHILDVGDHFLAPQLRYCAVHQFVVTRAEGLDWLPDAAPSGAVRALRCAVDGGADGLVVQLSLSNMSTPRVPDAPSHWQVRGTIAPWRDRELRSYPAGRLLTPRGPRRAGTPTPLRPLTVEVTDGRAVLNMLTAVPVTTRAEQAGPGPLHRLGPLVDAGDLELRTTGTGRLVARIPAESYRGEAAANTSGIVTVPAEAAWPEAADQGLLLTGTDGAGRRVTLLSEQEFNLQADEALLVLHHPDQAGGRDHAVEIPFRSYVRGRPAAVDRVHLRQYFNPRALPADADAGSPQARCTDAVVLGVRSGRLRGEGTYGDACVAHTDEDGQGWFTVRGVRPGTCRLLLTADPADTPCSAPEVPGSAWTAYDDEDALGYWAGAGALAVRVLPDDWRLNKIPSSEVDFPLLYREVFAYYEHVSSFMTSEVFSLADRCKVETYAELIWQMCDPGNRTKTYAMPPGRDLTDAKARLLLAYLRNCQAQVRPPVPYGIGSARGAQPRITTRGELWAALKQAATLELAVMLQYLYAAFSVPTFGAGREYVRRGLWTPGQLELACGGGGATPDDGIRGALLSVAREEMIHFLVVNNIVMAMGEPFHVPAFDFATVNSLLPIPLDFALEPLSVGSLQRYIAIEQPAELTPVLHEEDATPRGAAWGSVSELYGLIRDGLQRVPDLFLVAKGRGGGEHHLFMRQSVNWSHPDYQLEVDDLSSALFAVDFITEQGEGGVLARTAHSPEEPSHFRTFLRMSDLLTTERTAGPHGIPVPWNPAYPALRNPTLRAGGGVLDPVTDPEARAVMGLFNRSYYLMLSLMVQHFGESPDASLRRSKLMNAAIDVMTGMMRPLGELLTTLPSGRRGRTAGPSFELDVEPAFNSRPDVARRSLALRFEHLAEAARKCGSVPAQVPDMMAFYADFFHHTQGRP